MTVVPGYGEPQSCLYPGVTEVPHSLKGIAVSIPTSPEVVVSLGQTIQADTNVSETGLCRLCCYLRGNYSAVGRHYNHQTYLPGIAAQLENIRP